MAVLRTRVTGPVMLPDGSPAPNGGKVIFRLRSWDRQGGALIMKGPEEAVVVGGVIDKTLNRTTASERGTLYDVIYTYPNAAARGQWLEEPLGSISLTGAGPVALADLLAIPAPVPNVPDVLAQALGAAASAQAAAASTQPVLEDRRAAEAARDEARAAAGAAAADANAQIAPNVSAAAVSAAQAQAAVDTATGLIITTFGNFDSLAQLVAAHPTAALGNTAFVRETGEAGTVHRWSGSAWVDTGENPLAPIRELAEETDARTRGVENIPGDGLFSVTDPDGFAALMVGADGVTHAADLRLPNGLEMSVLGVSEIVGVGSGDYALQLEDEDGFIGFAIDQSGNMLGASVESSDLVQFASWVALRSPIAGASRIAMMFYGQPNSLGWTATPALSVSQPFQNVMVSGGAFVPLLGASEEKPWFAAANKATLELVKDAGRAPANSVMVGGGAGVGGAAISALQSGSSGYTNLIDQITAQKALDANLVVPALCFVQGESDAQNGMSEPDYLAQLTTLQGSVQASLRTVLGRADDVIPMVLGQISWGVQLYPGVALAQLAACNDGTERFFLAYPSYRIPYRSDYIHYTTPGVKLAGAYMGRAMAALARGKRPQWLNPRSATRRGRTIRVRFDVPALPLVLDRVGMAPTQDNGFRVVDGAGSVAIASVATDGINVVIETARDLSGTVSVRYALDYLAPGLPIGTNGVNIGASGNLRDSHPDLITIDGVDCQLFNAAPSFQLTAYSEII